MARVEFIHKRSAAPRRSILISGLACSEPGSRNLRRKLMSKRLLIVVILIWLFPVLVALQPSSASAKLPTLEAKGAAAIDRMLQAAIDKGDITGIVAAITNKDQVLYLKALGRQNVAQNVPMSKDTVFRVAS